MSKFFPRSKVFAERQAQEARRRSTKVRESKLWPDPIKGPYVLNEQTAAFLNDNLAVKK